MYEQELQEAGLTEYQAHTYTTLISSNGLSAIEVLNKVCQKLASERKIKKTKKNNLSPEYV